jgi:hypothetical protein
VLTYGVTVTAAFLSTPAYEAEMMTVEFAETCFVFTVNVRDSAPAGMVSVLGTCAMAAVPLAKVTTTPPAGAGPLRVTVPLEDVPPFTVAGFSASEAKATAEPPVGTL